jgi:hypothetical protein
MSIDVGVPSLQPARREIGHEAPPADEEWPTTQCFSRRAGEAFRGADYAAALEVPAGSSVSDATITIVMVIGAVLGAAVMILCEA